MTGYLQRLLDRSQPAPALASASGGEAPIARPAMPSRSPIAATDQRLNDPALAGLIDMATPPQASEADLIGPEANFGIPDAHERSVPRRHFADPQSTRRADRSGRRSGEAPTEAPATRRTEAPAPRSPAETGKAGQRDDPLAEPAESQSPPIPIEHPLRRLDVDFSPPPAEPTPQPEHSPQPSPPAPPTPETAMPAVPELRLVESPKPEVTRVPLPEQDKPPVSTEALSRPAETQAAPVMPQTAQTVEPPPLPAPPPPPAPEPETIIIEKTEPPSQVVRTEQPTPETRPPEPAERPVPRPKTAAAASLIGPLPQRMRVRTLFGVRRR